MKKYKWYIIGTALAISSILLLTSFIISRKSNKLNLIKKTRIRNKRPKKILIVGDSQSAIKTSDGKNITFTYPNILKRILEPKGFKVDVLALSGKTTKWMLDNLKNKLLNNTYDRIYIYGGGNDATSNLDLKNITIPNIQNMVNISKSTGADVIVNLGYRIDNFSDYNKMPTNQYIQSKEDWIPVIERRKLLQNLIYNNIKNANFIPVYDLYGLTTDGIHPNSKGHEIVAKVFLSTLNYE